MKCDNCHKTITKDCPRLQCSECKKTVHAYQVCTYLSADQMSTLPIADDDWICEKCSQTSKKKPATKKETLESRDEKMDRHADSLTQSETIDEEKHLSRKSEQLHDELKRNKKSENSKQSQKTNAISPEIRKQDPKCTRIENCEKINSLKMKIKEIEISNSYLKNRNNQLEIRIRALENHIRDVEQHFDKNPKKSKIDKLRVYENWTKVKRLCRSNTGLLLQVICLVTLLQLVVTSIELIHRF